MDVLLLLACKGRVLSSPTVATGAQPGKAACLLPAAWPSSLREPGRAPFLAFSVTHRPRRHIGFSSHKMIHIRRARRGAGARARVRPWHARHGRAGTFRWRTQRRRRTHRRSHRPHAARRIRPRLRGRRHGAPLCGVSLPAPSRKLSMRHRPAARCRAAVAPRAEKRHARVRPSAGLNPAPHPSIPSTHAHPSLILALAVTRRCPPPAA